MACNGCQSGNIEGFQAAWQFEVYAVRGVPQGCIAIGRNRCESDGQVPREAGIAYRTLTTVQRTQSAARVPDQQYSTVPDQWVGFPVEEAGGSTLQLMSGINHDRGL